MNNNTLTAANSIITISIADLYPVAQRLQGFAADNITDIDSSNSVETSMGVDGRLSGGFIHAAITQNVHLQADSMSCLLFENWESAQRTSREVYIATGTIILPATKRKYALTRGFLTTPSRMPSIGKTLQARRWTITWESISASPYGG